MLSISAGSTGGNTATDVDDFLPRFAITQPFDILPNIVGIPFGQFAIKAQHSAVLKKTVSVSAPIIAMMNSVLNCQKKHLPRQALETNGPLTLLSTPLRHVRITTILSTSPNP